MKRVLSLVLCVLLAATLVFPAMQAAAEAQTDVPQAVRTLMKKFPHLAYWNHVGSEKNNPDGITSQPCPTHAGCSWEPGACSCNSFSNAIQCMGFAYKAGYDLVGSDPRSWEMSETLDASKLRVGDVIRYRGNRHSLCVVGVKGNVIAFVDCNWYPMCQIRWDSMDLNDMPSFTYVLHDPKNKVKNSNVTFVADAQREGAQTTAAGTETPVTGEIWTTAGNLNLRKNTSLDAAVLDLVPQGTRLTVQKKKLNNGYLWGKTNYRTSTGWLALDYCNYIGGALNLPRFSEFPEEVSNTARFTLEWTGVDAADSYTVSLFDENGRRVQQKSVLAAQAAFAVAKIGNYSAEVESHSTHAESWVLYSGKTPFAVKKPEDIHIESISLNQTALTLKKGQTARLIAAVLPQSAATNTVVMFSGNPAVVTVDAKGMVRAEAFGETMVACTDTRSGRAAVCTVRVQPEAPQKLSQDMSKVRVGSVSLKWVAVQGADGYRIFRKSGSGAFRQIGTAKDSLYTDTGLQEGTTYLYQVCAFASTPNGEVEGENSAELTASTRPQAAQKIKFATKDGKVKVIWTAHKAASHYLVYASSTGKANTFKKIATVKGKNNYLAKGLKAGTTVYYKIVTVKTLDGKTFASRLSKTGKVKVK